MLHFNKPANTGNEEQYVLAAIRSNKISGDGHFGKKCQKWLEDTTGCLKALLTPSCTHALEMAAMLIDIQPGDEVIMPSYTFVSTANAFVLRGAKVVFVDIRPDTLNIDETLIEKAITSKTKAIIVVHYAGVSCEMDAILKTAQQYNLVVIEDAAQGIMAKYKDRHLGSIAHLGAYSFHETKNITSGGEGGALLINDEKYIQRAEIIREKGTNRSQFFLGLVDKYSWVDIGSSYLPSELQAAYLWGQFEKAEEITNNRLDIWKKYHHGLKRLENRAVLDLPRKIDNCLHNGHMFYLKLRDLEQRNALLKHLNSSGIQAVFHYIPLHLATAGERFSRFHGLDTYTVSESERLLRLPLWYGMDDSIIDNVISSVLSFFKE